MKTTKLFSPKLEIDVCRAAEKRQRSDEKRRQQRLAIEEKPLKRMQVSSNISH
jgi:hypothetical protein